MALSWQTPHCTLALTSSHTYGCSTRITSAGGIVRFACTPFSLLLGWWVFVVVIIVVFHEWTRNVMNEFGPHCYCNAIFFFHSDHQYKVILVVLTWDCMQRRHFWFSGRVACSQDMAAVMTDAGQRCFRCSYALSVRPFGEVVFPARVWFSTVCRCCWHRCHTEYRLHMRVWVVRAIQDNSVSLVINHCYYYITHFVM